MSGAETLPRRIGRHFQVESVLGTGGTSRVLRVLDERSGQHLALKLALAPVTSERARSHALFRQEFHVLSRMEHPNVVRAFELGVADGRPYYTMELLRGRPLSELAPIAWQRLCAILLDLCSPLSMLHARRFVHGDVTARNVLVTESGETKLIDFGALTATDRPASTIAGTPPHMAPELVRRQSIDGRVDMFAIGALAYSMLSGQHAYPAHTIQELPQVWSALPLSLRERGFAIPPALDELIMSLLSLDVSARPQQLAELVQRLSSIIDTSYALDAASLQAQLATPKLVGRDDALDHFRALHRSAVAGRGGALFFGGEKGIGRSRMLEACALDAIHAGSLVVHVAPEQAPSVPFGLTAHIFSAALAQDAGVAQQLPAAISVTRDASELAAVLARQDPELLRLCWRALCSMRPAVVLVDDLTRADPASVGAFLSSIDAAGELPLLLVAAVESGQSKLGRDAAALISESRTLTLSPLSYADTAQLLRSIFGEAAHLEALIAWVHRAAAGIPGACVELAHHAVEQGYVSFHEGQFRVSDDVSSGRAELPEALDATIARTIAALPERSREALGALSLVTPFGPLTAAEQEQLLLASAGWTQADVSDVLDTLRDAQLITLVGSSYELRSQSVERHARLQLTAEQTQRWHRRLAQLYEPRGHDFHHLTVLHYEYAGDRARAYEMLLGSDERLRGPDDPNIRVGGSQVGIELHRNMLAHAAAARSRVETIYFRRVLIRIGATADPRLISEAPALLAQLRDDAGLLFWADAPRDLSDAQKLQRCLLRARQRFDASPAGERLAPDDAIRQLADSASTVTSICAAAFDASYALRIAEQFRPLRTLSPELDLSYRVVELTALQLSRGGLMIEHWRSLLARLREKPEGWQELIWRYRLGWLHFNLGRELAQLGDAEALEHAQLLAAHQRTHAQAASVRLLYALAHGDHDAAMKYRRQRAIAALASRYEDQRLTLAYIAEVELLDACGDLLELQHTAAWLEAKAAQLAGFRPFAAYARACCLLLCGQVSEAQQLVELQVHAAPALEHAAWALLRGLRAELALAAGEPRLAQEMARDVLLVAAEAGLDHRALTRPRRVLALACAALGEHDEALAAVEPWRQVFAAEHLTRTVHAGQLHETLARIGLAAGERSAFDAHCERARAIYGATGNPGLLARLQRLTATAAQSQNARWVTVQNDLERMTHDGRADYLLLLLMQDARADAGLLYRVAPDGHVRCVAVERTLADDALAAQVSAYLERIVTLADDVTRTVQHDWGQELLRTLPGGETERFSSVLLRGSDAKLRGVVLLHGGVESVPSLRGDGLTILVADALAKLPDQSL